jgi:addiction module RelE/StbE family toxin
MTIKYSKGFLKHVKKLSPELRQQLQDRLVLFDENPLHPTLRNHALKGKYKDYRSISVTGDVRVLYLQSGDEVIFDAVGTHSQLYG